MRNWHEKIKKMMRMNNLLCVALAMLIAVSGCDNLEFSGNGENDNTEIPGENTGGEENGDGGEENAGGGENTGGEDNTGGEEGGDSGDENGGAGEDGGENGDEGGEEQLPELPAGVTRVTVAEFLAAEVSDVQWYGLTGTIENLTDTTYGDFDLRDETGVVYIYGLTKTKQSENDKSFSSLGLKEGDVITIVGQRYNHKGKDEMKYAYYIDAEQSVGPDQPDQPDVPSNPDASIKTAWLELPAMSKDSGLEYYSHDFKMNGKTYRNYSFGWSQKDYVALWVAYPMCGMYVEKNVGRTDKWAYDPKLGSKKSSAPFGGYGGSYSRGHQVASSDRLCCREANEQTFYGTNMTPQLQDLNGVKWEHLEKDVQALCKAVDTVYVVTGCVVKGSTKKALDSDDNQMTVPVGYYKALLSYDASSSTNRWACSAFYFEHKAYSRSTKLKTLTMSVDDLEAKTGFDFFPNLKDKIGAEEADRLEAQDPKNSTLWWSYID